MDSLELKPIRRTAGKVRLPGSKSISNRVLLLAALASGDTEVSGLVDAESLGADGYPPLALHPAAIKLNEPVTVKGDVSSQFLTALLMALPLLDSKSRVEVQGELISRPYVEITLNVMRRFGVEVARREWHSFEVPAARYVSPGRIYVEGDASSASYFLAAGAIGGGPVRVEGVGRDSIQGDVRFTEVL